MDFEGLLAILIVAAICALLAFVVALLLKTRQSVLGYIGAGLLGRMLGDWLGAALKARDWPGHVSLLGATVHLLWTLIGAFLVLLVVRLVGARRR